jgi:hypothetical protein
VMGLTGWNNVVKPRCLSSVIAHLVALRDLNLASTINVVFRRSFLDLPWDEVA